ncbi:hypothetical protein ACFSSA_10165 [Luteolibacter algae]|uniref:Uncharacterized protein n=1 Tax=Luteolibacter algae TaxID=454151 RepID=A0ABW5D9D2_9BACT
MRETLIVIGLFVLAMALRSSRKNIIRKLGAFAFLFATFFFFFYLSDSVIVGLMGACLWFFLPWIELLTHVRRLRMPLNNRLRHRELPNPSFFPNAIEAATGMEEAGFEHVSDCGWEWSGMQQHFRLFWNPEERAIASVCLCEQDKVAFAFVSVTSTDAAGNIWRTTNFPFAPTLRCSPGLKWNHVPCEKSCFHQILKDHQAFLVRMKIGTDDLLIPDPEAMEEDIENEMRKQVDHNLRSGIIHLTDDGHFRYSKRGLFFLWGQFIKDMIRLC